MNQQYMQTLTIILHIKLNYRKYIKLKRKIFVSSGKRKRNLLFYLIEYLTYQL